MERRRRRGNAIRIITTSCTKVEVEHYYNHHHHHHWPVHYLRGRMCVFVYLCVLYMCAGRHMHAFQPNALQSLFVCERERTYFFLLLLLFLMLFLLFLFCYSRNYQIIGFQSGRISSSLCDDSVRGRSHAPIHFVFCFCSCSIHFVLFYTFIWNHRPEIDWNRSNRMVYY